MNGMCIETIYYQEHNRLFRKPPLLGPPLSLPADRIIPESTPSEKKDVEGVGMGDEPACFADGNGYNKSNP